MQWIKSLDNHRKATPRKIADVAAYEAKRNPDGRVTYGFRDVRDQQCLDRVPAGIPAKYKGQVDSHAYATAANKRSIYVADAGANAILKVDKHSKRVSTVAVLPAASFRVTAVLAAGMGLPDCVVGERYYLSRCPLMWSSARTAGCTSRHCRAVRKTGASARWAVYSRSIRKPARWCSWPAASPRHEPGCQFTR